MDSPKHALIIYNPVARSLAEPDVWMGPIVHQLCNDSDWLVSARATRPGLTGQDLLQSVGAPLDLVIAAGGDGTIQAVVAALASTGSQTPLGIIPAGTGNQLARNLGIYSESLLTDPLERAIATILRGTPIRIDLGVMNGHYFTVAAGAGPMSDAVIIPGRDDKTNWKMLAYASSMIQTLAMPPIVFSVSADDEKFEIAASGIFVTNVADLGVGSISETADLSDGLLDLCVLNPQHFQDYLELGFRFVGGFAGGDAPNYIRKIKKVDIEVVRVRSPMSSFQQMTHRVRSWWRGRPFHPPPVRREVTAMIDGDACGTTPMRIEVAPQAVSVLVPSEALSS